MTFKIVNGVPPYTIRRMIQGSPDTPESYRNGGKFAVFTLGGLLVLRDHVVTYTIKDKVGNTVTAKLTINKQPY